MKPFKRTATAAETDEMLPVVRKVGDRIALLRNHVEDRHGTLIEDYAAFILSPNSLGRDWAPPRRWAISLDSGRLVFADDEDLGAVDTVDDAVDTASDDARIGHDTAGPGFGTQQ